MGGNRAQHANQNKRSDRRQGANHGAEDKCPDLMTTALTCPGPPPSKHDQQIAGPLRYGAPLYSCRPGLKP